MDSSKPQTSNLKTRKDVHLIDMVHHNPGEKPFQSAYTDPFHLKSLTFRGQCLKHINTIIRFEGLFEKFPEVDGLIVRVGENYLFDTPFHTGNSAVTYHFNSAATLPSAPNGLN